MLRRKEVQTKKRTYEKLRDDKRSDENLQTKNCPTKKYHTKMCPVTELGCCSPFLNCVVIVAYCMKKGKQLHSHIPEIATNDIKGYTRTVVNSECIQTMI